MTMPAQVWPSPMHRYVKFSRGRRTSSLQKAFDFSSRSLSGRIILKTPFDLDIVCSLLSCPFPQLMNSTPFADLLFQSPDALFRALPAPRVLRPFTKCLEISCNASTHQEVESAITLCSPCQGNIYSAIMLSMPYWWFVMEKVVLAKE